MDLAAIIKEENRDDESDDDDFIFSEIHICKPFYNWVLAEGEHGLFFKSIARDGFDGFVKEKFLNDFICVRKCYILRDYSGLRFWIHKFKGSFKLFYCDFISKPSEVMLSYIDHGLTTEIMHMFCNFIVRLEIFVERIAYLARETNNPIRQEQLLEIRKSMDLCDSFEDEESYNLIMENRRMYVEDRFSLEFGKNGEYLVYLTSEQVASNNLCSRCVIY